MEKRPSNWGLQSLFSIQGGKNGGGQAFLERDVAVNFFELSFFFPFGSAFPPQAECHLIELHLIEGRRLVF